MPTNNAWNSQDPAQVSKGGTGRATLTQHSLLVGNATTQVTELGVGTDGQVMLGATGADPSFATVTSTDSSLSFTPGAASLAIVTAKASSAEVLTGTDAVKAITPSTLNSTLSLMDMSGFISWGGAGNYFDDTTLGSFSILRPGIGMIKGRQITWTATQTVTGLTAGNTYYIYIDNTGTIQKTSSRTDQLFIDNIVLFECLRDSTPVTNNQFTVKENHPYDYPATVSNYEHDNIGTLIENNQNGANITLNGTQKIQINGADVLSDHGLETTIPDSGGVGVTWKKYYTTAGGKWALDGSSDTFLGRWNNAGTPTNLSAGNFGVYTLYASKDSLNTTTPLYFAVLNTAQFANQAAATTAIANGTTAKATNELNQLEVCQLGYIVYRQSIASITVVTISKATLKQTLSTSGTNTASLVTTNTSAFTGWLSAANTNVQSSLDTLDQVLIGGTSGQIVSSNGASTQPTFTTATFPKTTGAGEIILSNAANTAISSNSLTGNFTFTSATAGATRTVLVNNTDNTNAASTAIFRVASGGASSGDAIIQYNIDGINEWTSGIDNSDADSWVMSSGNTLGTSNVMRIQTTGEITYPLQSAFSANRATTVNDVTGDGTLYTLIPTTVIFDQNSDYNNGTGIFTAPVTGRYFLRMSAEVLQLSSAMTYGYIRITTTNRSYYSNGMNWWAVGGATNDTVMTFCAFADMNAGDTAKAQIVISNGTKVADIASSEFSGYLAC